MTRFVLETQSALPQITKSAIPMIAWSFISYGTKESHTLVSYQTHWWEFAKRLKYLLLVPPALSNEGLCVIVPVVRLTSLFHYWCVWCSGHWTYWLAFVGMEAFFYMSSGDGDLSLILLKHCFVCTLCSESFQMEEKYLWPLNLRLKSFKCVLEGNF